jgi:hypothetical protein
MPRLRIESAADAFNLDEISRTGTGVEALSGVTGLGLPRVATSWFEGAGDGAEFSDRRYLPRQIDIPLHFYVQGRTELQAIETRFARMMTGPMTFRFVEDDGSDWSLQVRRTGGGDWVYGVDTVGRTELSTVVTLTAGDPIFTYSVEEVKVLGTSNPDRGLIRTAPLSQLQMSGAQVSGPVTFENTGDEYAAPVWYVTGPGSNFEATGPNGESFIWEGSLSEGESLIIDTKTASVTDGTGANRYADMGPAPRFWKIPPGTSTAVTSLGSTNSVSAITVKWRPRKGSVI